MLGGLWFGAASRAGCVRVVVEPGGVGSQVTLRRSRLVDPSCYQLPQTQERVRRARGGIVVVWGSGRVSGPVQEEHVPSVVWKGAVCLFHELGGGISIPGGWGAWRTSGKRVRPSCSWRVK